MAWVALARPERCADELARSYALRLVCWYDEQLGHGCALEDLPCVTEEEQRCLWEGHDLVKQIALTLHLISLQRVRRMCSWCHEMEFLSEAGRTICSNCGHFVEWVNLLAAKEQELVRSQSESTAREHVLRERCARLAHHEYQLREELHALQSGAAWRLVRALRRCRRIVAPPGTLRDRSLLLLKRTAKLWRREGMFALLPRIVRKLRALFSRLRSQPVEASATTPTQRAVIEQAANSGPIVSSAVVLNPADRELLHEILLLQPGGTSRRGQPIDVIVPVYKGLDETLRCLRSVLAATVQVDYELIVLNDCSPDPALTRCLRDIAKRGLITLLENPHNLGFVKTTNRGMTLHADRDVVLLNSDTEVCHDWLDRLHRAAYSSANVGSVTPLSNSATICSYPRFCHDSVLPEDATAQQLDAWCAERNAGDYVDVPTGVGFCMFVRRDCVNAVGLLDEQHFGKGYGEENDFCVRASERGWRHLLTTDTFVYHRGGTSFGDSKNPAIERAMKTLEALHPEYPILVAAHVAANPARHFRRRLDLARLAGPPAIVYVLHNLGGGTERHVLELAQRMEREGRRALLLRPGEPGQVTLACPAVADTPNLVFDLPREHWTLWAALRERNVERAHFHHRIRVPADVFRLIDDLDVPYDWTIHDYYSICPRINLVDETGTYCGEPDAAHCQACVDRNGAYDLPDVNVVRWRAENGALLAGAQQVFVPHADGVERMKRYYPDVSFVERRHFEERPTARLVAAPFTEGETLRVAVIGTLAWHKGLEILARCGRDAVERSLPMCFHVVGDTARFDFLQGLPSLQFSGPYEEDAIFDLLASLGCHCAFFPSIWPETYTFTLSIAFIAGLFPISFDLGAPAARIRELGFGHVMPLTRDARIINDELLMLRPRLVEPPRAGRWSPVEYRSLLTDYYGLSERERRGAA